MQGPCFQVPCVPTPSGGCSSGGQEGLWRRLAPEVFSEGSAGSDKAGASCPLNDPALLQHQPLTSASGRPAWSQQPLPERRRVPGALRLLLRLTTSAPQGPRGHINALQIIRSLHSSRLPETVEYLKEEMCLGK